MLSDESSSDSETGRFKSRPKKQDIHTKSSAHSKGEDNFKSAGRSRFSVNTGRSRPSENDKFHREINKKIDERERYECRSRERQRYPKYSPPRRKHSRERSPYKRPNDDRHEGVRRHGGSTKDRPRDNRSDSKDRKRHSRSRSHKSPNHGLKDSKYDKPQLKEVVKGHSYREKDKGTNKFNRISRDSSTPEYKCKKSVVLKPTIAEIRKPKSPSPVVVVDHSNSEEDKDVQLGSYYSIPTIVPDVVKEKSLVSSEIDSSDDEKLRAKLLNLEKQLHKSNKKKKHRKKHKSHSSKSKDRDSSTVEVSSTTDIDKVKVDSPKKDLDVLEVSSTQKIHHKESSEEGEITSDNDSIEIDPTDLRHKLKQRSRVGNKEESPKNTCGSTLLPHLEKIKNSARSLSQNIEGPALPPHLQKSRNIGPSIPHEMRKVLAETDREVIVYESSDEDPGIGPLPSGAESKWSEAHQRLEERALNIKIRNIEGHSLSRNKIKSREEWMLELPEGKAKILGLEARSFRAKAGPDMSDRSSWTDTPEEKARKAAGVQKEVDLDVVLKEEARSRHIAKRDEQQEKDVKKHKKKHKRDESLLEMHEKKLKKKKKKEERDDGKKERRPFSRDVDLQVNRFDEAQKKSIIKKAQALDGRFSRGESKFL